MASLKEMVKEAGLTQCGLIRVCGANGLTNKQTMFVAGKAGFEPAKGTVAIQRGKGKRGEAVPSASKDIKARIKSLAAKAGGADEADEKPAKKNKDKVKAASKETTKSKSKKEPSDDGDDD